jgi:hypothetical protein
MPELSEIELATKDSASRENAGWHSGQTTQPAFPPGRFSLFHLEAALVLGIGAVFVVGVFLQRTPLNGSLKLTGWEWPWRNDIELLRVVVFLLAPFSMIHYALRKSEKEPDSRLSICLGILALGNFLLQVMGILTDPRGWGLIQQIVLSPNSTSYFTDASHIHGLAAWLRNFDHATLGFHSSTHPPGPILFYYLFFASFGSPKGALLGGCAVGLMASLGVCVMYVFAGLWTENRHTRIVASAFYALLPSLTVFFPEMDQIYPILSMLLILFWCRSLDSRHSPAREAAFAGLILSATILFAYNLLTVGVFLCCYSLYGAWRQGWSKSSWVQLARSSGIVAGVCAGAYTLLWLTTGYNPIASFLNALSNQAVYDATFARSNALFSLFDPYDFFLGAGMLALPLVLFQLIRILKDFDLRQNEVALSLIGLASIATVDLTGVLRGEAARVWMFLMPLLVVPVALELSRFEQRWRTAIFWMQFLILACLKANMIFVNA